jgi:hypothetical protein
MNIFYILRKVFINLVEMGEMVSWKQRYALSCLRTERRWQCAETASSDVGAIVAYDWVTFTKASSVETVIHLLSETI